MTAIINLNNGAVNAISWDDGCYFCASNGPTCQPNGLSTATMTAIDSSSGIVSCFTPQSTCYATSTSSPSPSPSPGAKNSSSSITVNQCDLQLFVTWSGTDAGGLYMTSQNKRFSRFRQFGTASLVQSATNIGTAALNAVTGTVNADTIFPGARRRLAGGGGGGGGGAAAPAVPAPHGATDGGGGAAAHAHSVAEMLPSFAGMAPPPPPPDAARAP